MDQETLTFVLNAVDNVTPAAQRAIGTQEQVAASAGRARQAVDAVSDASAAAPEIIGSQERIVATADAARGSLDAVDGASLQAPRIAEGQRQIAESAQQAKASLDSTTLSFVAQLAAAQALKSGIDGVRQGLVALELVDDKTAKSLEKVSAATNVVIGTFQLYKGLQPVLAATKASLLSLAAVETYRSVLSSPWKLALVGAGLGAAAGIGGMLMTQNNSTTVEQSIVFGGGTSNDQRSMQRDMYEGMM